jgi:hypothetical protein
VLAISQLQGFPPIHQNDSERINLPAQELDLFGPVDD